MGHPARKLNQRISHHLYGPNTSLQHRLIVGACFAVCGVAFMKLHSGWPVFDIFIETLGTFINAAGLTPYIEHGIELAQSTDEEE